MSAQDFDFFLKTIQKENYASLITDKTPWAYFTLEVYDTKNIQIRGSGGLGILAADTALEAHKLGIPFQLVTLYYPRECKKKLTHFQQEEHCDIGDPESRGFEKLDMQVEITVNTDSVPIGLYKKDNILVLYEPGLQELYAYGSDSEHRVYQEAVLGFGGYRALKKLGVDPSIYHLNEAGAVFAALAYLDDLCTQGKELNEAIEMVRSKTLFTNHTLLPTASASFKKEVYERYVYRNLTNKAVVDWMNGLIASVRGTLRLSTIALEIAGKHNGVSRLHSEIANSNFKRVNNTPVTFTAITNGIFLDRWLHPELMALYKRVHAIDELDIVDPSAPEALDRITAFELRRAKHRGKEDLYKYLTTRQDQYGEPIEIPYHDQVAIWARRFAGYKRPFLLFEDTQRLSALLVRSKFHLVLAGSAHSNDEEMKGEIARIMHLVDANDDLKKRIHFIQDYDDEVAKYLAQGAHVFINTPKVGNEACGTSWMKAMINCSMIISTKDGGIADIDNAPYLMVTGQNYPQEVASTYRLFERALEIINSDDLWREFVLNQLKTYMPIISGTRMMGDYLNFFFSSK